jgi:hypothetical protein
MVRLPKKWYGGGLAAMLGCTENYLRDYWRNGQGRKGGMGVCSEAMGTSVVAAQQWKHARVLDSNGDMGGCQKQWRHWYTEAMET